MKKKSIISIIICICIVASALFTSCGGNNGEASSKATESATEASAADGIDYMALVNKTHALPDNWEKNLETVKITNSVKTEVEVEKKAYDAYLKLKSELEGENIFVDLDSARRSVADQQRIMDEFTRDYGADYAAKTVAQPGFSEHHTGLALDLYLIIDGKDVTENEDMEQYPEIWEKIHEKLPKYGFILRYLKDKEHITGYGYEPWHIRYLDNTEIAQEITDKGITLEGYLNAASEDPVTIDLGKSELYSEEELNDAVVQIKCKFAFWPECKLNSIRYAGDEAATEKNLKWINKINNTKKYTKVAEFLMDFHTPENMSDKTLESDFDYKDYQWWLAYTEKDGWEIASQGY